MSLRAKLSDVASARALMVIAAVVSGDFLIAAKKPRAAIDCNSNNVSEN